MNDKEQLEAIKYRRSQEYEGYCTVWKDYTMELEVVLEDIDYLLARLATLETDNQRLKNTVGDLWSLRHG